MTVLLMFLTGTAWCYLVWTTCAMLFAAWLASRPDFREAVLERGGTLADVDKFRISATLPGWCKRAFLPTAWLVAYHGGAIGELLR